MSAEPDKELEEFYRVADVVVSVGMSLGLSVMYKALGRSDTQAMIQASEDTAKLILDPAFKADARRAYMANLDKAINDGEADPPEPAEADQCRVAKWPEERCVCVSGHAGYHEGDQGSRWYP